MRTEVGVDQPILTFSNCFGDPFLPCDIDRYVSLFEQKLLENPEVNVWMINTGLDPYGERYDLDFTRHMVSSIISGYHSEDFECYNEDFGMYIPKYVTDYKRILNPLVNKSKKDLLFEQLYSKLEKNLEYEKVV